MSLAKADLPILTRSNDLSKYSDGQTIYLDSRSSWKFFLEHIPGATLLPNWKKFTETRKGVPGLIIKDLSILADKISKLGVDKNKNILIYGDPQDPWRTDGRFLWMFHYLGFENVSLLEGGISAWKKQGNDIEMGRAGKIKQTEFKASDIQLNTLVIANKDWIEKRLGDVDLSIIDTRTTKEFNGSTPYGSRKGGHIPGAIHIDWRNFFNESGLLKSKATLIKLLRGHDITENKNIVVYCTGGVRSAMAYFVLRYLGFKARNYDGSWWDWSSTNQPTEL